MAGDREMVLQTIVVVMSRRRLDEHESTATYTVCCLYPIIVEKDQGGPSHCKSKPII